MGSSASRITGRLMRALAMATRCCSPPESCSGKEDIRFWRPTQRKASKARRLRSLVGALDGEDERHVLVDRTGGDEPEVLEDHADASSKVGHLPGGEGAQVPPVDEDLAGGGHLLADDQLKEGAFARSRGSGDEAELARMNDEVHIAEGEGFAAVGLVHVVETDHRVGRRERRAWTWRSLAATWASRTIRPPG